MNSYLRWSSQRGSWHVLDYVNDAGWHLRCGRVMKTESAKAQPSLPYGEKTCESCAANALRAEAPSVDNDTVPG